MSIKYLMQLLAFISVPVIPLVHSAESGNGASLKRGDALPPFQANDQNGDLWRSKDHIGKGNLVIYFFPAALTGG